MARVEWTRYSGDDVEHVVAIMTLRENKSGSRIRPSRGDGGVDIIVPTGDPEEIDVHQVKRFASNLTSGQKIQIAKSYKRLLKRIEERGLKVRKWYLVMPLDATNENLDWFAELTEEAPFASEWPGLAYVEGLAAKYPDVIDYYLRDGKDRLEAKVQDLTKLIMLGRTMEAPPDGTLRPTDVQAGLVALHAELNRYDPHYRYDFSVDAKPSAVSELPGLVFAVHVHDANVCTTFKVFARFREATEERPIPIQLTWNVEEGTEHADLLRDWIEYGTPFEAPLGSADLDLDLPGGLGGRVEGAGVVLGTPAGAIGHEVRAVLVDPSNQEVASVLLKMNPMTRGLGGGGIRVTGQEEHGTFTIEVRITPAQELKLSVTALSDFSGKRPAELLPGLRFLAAFRTPNELRFGAAYGPVLQSGIPIPTDAVTGSDEDLVLETVEALATIQETTSVQVFAPDFTTMTTRQAEALILAARLLRGEGVTARWESYPLRVKPDALSAAAPALTAVFDEPFAVMIGKAKVPLGTRRVQLVAAKLEILEDTPGQDGLVAARFVPLGDNHDVIMRLVSTNSSRSGDDNDKGEDLGARSE